MKFFEIRICEKQNETSEIENENQKDQFYMVKRLEERSSNMIDQSQKDVCVLTYGCSCYETKFLDVCSPELRRSRKCSYFAKKRDDFERDTNHRDIIRNYF